MHKLILHIESHNILLKILLNPNFRILLHVLVNTIENMQTLSGEASLAELNGIATSLQTLLPLFIVCSDSPATHVHQC